MSHGFKCATRALVFVFVAASACKAHGPAKAQPRPVPVREQRETRYANGQLKERFSVVEDEIGNYVKDGPDVSFHLTTGHESSEENYKAGKLEGRWRSWNEYGELTEERTYRDGTPDGAWSEYENGKLVRVRTYEHGGLSGPYTYLGLRELVVAGTMANEVPAGIWTIADKAGKVHARARFEFGRLKAPVQSFASDGAVRPQLPAQGCADFGGYALDTVRYGDVVFEVFERTHSFPTENRANPLSNGRVLLLDPAHLAEKGIDQLNLLFDTDEALTALTGSADQARSDAGAARSVEAFHAAFSKKYTLVSEPARDSTDFHAVYKNGGCTIQLSAAPSNSKLAVSLSSERYLAHYIPPVE